MGTAQSWESEEDDNGILPSGISQSYFSDDDDDKSAYHSDPELASITAAGNAIFPFYRHRRRARHSGGSPGLHGGPGPGPGPGRSGNGGGTNRGRAGRTTHHTDMLSNGNVEMALELQLKDSWVSCFRGMVVLVLLTATTLLATLSYRVTKMDQQEDFKHRFQDLAAELIEVTRGNTEHSLNALDSLSTTMTNWAIGTNSTWPFVTFPEFETQVAQVMKQSQPSIVAVVPLVSQDQRTQWEGYTLWNQGWVQQGLNYRKEQDGDKSTATETAQPTSPFIYHLKEFSPEDADDQTFEPEVADQDPKDGLYAPVWQYAPVQKKPLVVNLDVLEYSYFRRIHQLLESTTARSNNNELSSSVLAEIIEPGHQACLLDLSAKLEVAKQKEQDQEQGSKFKGLEDPQTWPQSFMVAPIFDSHHAPTKKLVALIVGLEPVHVTISHHLIPEGSTGLILVVQNTCHDSSTYEIDDGPTAVFLGYGDLHDRKYSHHKVTSSDTGFPIMKKEEDNSTDCVYTFHVYPSERFEVASNRRQPIRSTGVIIGVFVVTAIFFFLYDCFVERRQALVLSAARRSNQIVNSLFPANVRDRLVNHNGNGAQRTPNQEQAQPTVQAVTELVTGMPKAVLHAARNPSVLIPDLRTIPNRLSAAAPFITGGALSSTSQHPHPRRGSREWKVNNNNNSSTNGGGDDYMFSASRSGKPIADFFPFVSVMFSDIVGFTAWSSVREPFQVFTLLESVYNAFDRIAKRLRIFKVETIGDCYVAAAGVPDPRDDHAVALARFARACLAKMSRIVHKLERELGPGTGDLTMRVGIHSGAVTAGVLRGEKSRFQLFGDTVNTAARMESTGERSKIQVSSETANLLMGAGKAHWVTPREEKVVAKGKGELQTYWLDVHSRRRVATQSEATPTDVTMIHVEFVEEVIQELEAKALSPSVAGDDSQVEGNDWDSVGEMPDGELGSDSVICDDIDVADDRIKRLVGWSVDVLQNLLKRIVAMRDDEDENTEEYGSDFEEEGDDDDEEGEGTVKRKKNVSKKEQIEPLVETSNSEPARTTVLEEVKEIITLPSQASKYKRDPSTVRLSSAVVSQLERYVSKIANMYPNNSFHNFEHASHVCQSVCKLLARVVTPDCTSYGSDMSFRRNDAESLPATQLHEYTYGITSDPLTQFACAFSALIHDVDHSGVPNAQLVKEQTDLAVLYKNKSVAEQNSVDLAWDMLMQPEYSDLRSCIYKSRSQLDRFRQLVVNSVMATDIADKELGALRKARWAKAFDTNAMMEKHDDDDNESVREKMALDDVNRKATIVIEHLIQASDVAHTMQHWYVYKKWNERLFHEMYRAYLEGRAGSDPSKNWYAGELGFFDFYVLPLAQKLKECGVFGVASEEYLTYAMANRQEWQLKGKETVRGYLSAYADSTENGSVVSV